MAYRDIYNDLQLVQQHPLNNQQLSDQRTQELTTELRVTRGGGKTSANSSAIAEFDLKGNLRTLHSTDDINQQITITNHIKLCYFDTGPDESRNELIQSGIVPRLVKFLKNDDSCVLQINAACIIQIIAWGTSEQALVLITHDTIANLARLLDSNIEELQNQALYTLADLIRNHRVECSQQVMDQGVLVHVLAVLDRRERAVSVYTATAVCWCLLALCQGNLPNKHESTVVRALRSLLHDTDTDVLKLACFAVADFIGSADAFPKDRRIAAVFQGNENVGERLIAILTEPREDIAIAALTAVGEIIEDGTHFLELINYSLLSNLLWVLVQSKKSQLRTMACRTILNITDTHKAHVYNTSVEVMEEYINALVREGCVDSLCDLLNTPGDDILAPVLDTLMNILTMEDKHGKRKSAEKLRKKSVKVLKNLLAHESQEIHRKVSKLIKFF